MKKSTIVLLRMFLVLIGIGALVFLLVEPHVEGRNVNATAYEVYFNDPFLVYAYIASMCFFFGLSQAFFLLACIEQHKLYSQQSIHALKMIRYAALMLIGFITLPLLSLFIVRPGDDIAGGVAMALLLMVISGVVGVVAKVWEKKLRNGQSSSKW